MTFSILQVNAWLLPPPFSAENQRRLAELIALIRAKRPHVVTLQEIWLHRFIRELRAQLGEYHVVTSKRSHWYNHSGLVTLSRLPVLRTAFQKFSPTTRHRLVERLAQKGMLKTVVRFRKKLVTVINTHLYNPEQREEHAIRNRQLRTVERIQNRLIVISGDLNVRRNELSAEFRRRWAHIRYIYLRERNKYELARFNRKLSSNRGLVYLLSNGFQRVRAAPISQPVLSDHFVLYAALKL